MTRHFRPFADWPLQSPVLRALYEGLARGDIPHAILFAGASGTTRMFAEFFSKILLCTGEGAPCNACPSCRQMDAHNHPDFIVVAGEDGGPVKAAQVEETQARLKLRGHGQGRIVYLIEGMDKLTPVAANRLLKTLEEPLASTIALLTAENDGRVLSTIRSRTFLYRLGAGNAPFADPLPESLATRDSEQNLSFAALLKPVIQWMEYVLQKERPTLTLAADLLKQTESYALGDVLHVLIVWLRDVLHIQLDEHESLVCEDFIESLQKQAKLISTAQLLQILEIVLESKRRVDAHVVARLNIEQMCIRVREVIRSV
jgi:DNA polymerase III subunit delta'